MDAKLIGKNSLAYVSLILKGPVNSFSFFLYYYYFIKVGYIYESIP